MKKLLFGVLTAFGVALGANAALGTAETTFETGDETVTVQSSEDSKEDPKLMTGDYWSVDNVEETEGGVATYSKVTKYAGDDQGVVKSAGGYGKIGNGETGMTDQPGSNYLSIDADSVLLRKNEVTLDSTYYIDTMVKFTATDLDDDKMKAEIATGEKIVVWMYKGEADLAPVLKVAAGYIGADKVQGNVVTAVDKKVYTAKNNFQENTWYRLSVKAINNAYGENARAVYFVVCIDGVPLTYTEKFYYNDGSNGYGAIFANPSWAYDELSSSILPSLVPGATTLSGLGFKGNGAVDNILFSASAPCDSLIDGDTVPLFQVGEGELQKKYATFDKAVEAALKASADQPTIKPTIKLIADTGTAGTYLDLDFSKTSLTEDKTLVLDLNGKTLYAVNGTSIQVMAKTLKNVNEDESATRIGKVQIINTVDTATVKGTVQGDADIIIGDASGTYGDTGVTYEGTFVAFGNPFTLYKGKFVNDPTAIVDEVVSATVAPGYVLVNPTPENAYYTIAEAPTTEVTITLGTGIKSATYQIGNAEPVKITESTPINVAIGAVIKVTETTVFDGYTANYIAPVTVSATTTTIEVKATLNQYDLTITRGDEGVASATVKIGENEAQAVEFGTPIKVPYNSAVVISATAAEGYTLVEIAKEDASFDMPANNKTVNITATKDTPATATLVISWKDENVKSVFYAIDNGDATETKSGDAISVDVGKPVTITATVADWYKAVVDPAAVFDMPTDGKTVTITATKIASSDIGASTKPADVGITGGAFENASQADLQNVVAWAADKGVSVAVVNAMDFTSKGTDEQELFEEAYLLNCGTGDVAGEKAKFKITSFTLVNGILTPTLPDDSKYNGTVTEMGAETIGAAWKKVDDNNRGKLKFFKAILTFKPIE